MRPHIALLAGESSGDKLGAPLLRELKKRFPNARFSGVGGVAMQAEGLESLIDIKRLSVMGLVEVLRHLPDIWQAEKALLAFWRDNPPDVFIGIDAPDFNLRMARALKAQGVKTVHYVSPSLWAWKEKRIVKIQQAIDLMLCLFPFETAIYEQHGVKALCVGHAMRERLQAMTQHEARMALGLPAVSGKLLGLFTGSRASERERLTSIFLQAYQQLKPYNYQAIIQPPIPQSALQNLGDAWLVDASSELIMNACDVLLLKSGTITLEAALLQRPMVVAHRVNPLTAFIARRMLKTKRFALPNLLLQQDVIPELMQEECQPERITQTILQLDITAQQSALRNIVDLLPDNASQTAADAIVECFNASFSNNQT